MFDSQSETAGSAAPPVDDFVQLTFPCALRVWWAYFWRTTLISFVIVAIFDFVLASSAGVLLPAGILPWLVRAMNYFGPYVVAFFIIRYVLGKTFRDFRIVLLPRAAASGGQSLPRTFRRTLSVWWAFSWRAVVYSLIVTIAAMLPIGMLIGVLSEFGRAASVLANLAVGLVIGGAVGMYIFYSNILGEEFSDFRVCLISREATVSPVPSAPSSNPNAEGISEG